MQEKNIYSTKGVFMRYLLIVLLMIVVVSCGSDEKKSQENGDTTNTSQTENNYEPVEDNDATYSLKYKFDEGNEYRYNLRTISNNTQVIETDTTITASANQTIDYEFSFEVVELDEQNVAELSVNIETINLDAMINGEKIEYNTDNELTPEEKREYLEYEAMANNPFRVRITEIGEVLEVSRIDKIIDKVLEMEGLVDSLSLQEKQQLMSNIGETLIKPLTQQLFRVLPKSDVGKDSSWSQNYPSQLMVFQLNNTAKFTVLDIVQDEGDKLAKVSAGLNATFQGDKEAQQQGVQYSFNDPQVSGSGTWYFNIDEGLIQESETMTRIETSVNISAADAANNPIKAFRKDIAVNTNIITKL